MRKISCRLFTYSNIIKIIRRWFYQRTSCRERCRRGVAIGKQKATPGTQRFPMEHMPRFSHSSLRLTINILLLLLRELDRDV